MGDIFDQLAAGAKPASNTSPTAAPAPKAATPPAASTAPPAASSTGDMFDQLAAGVHPSQVQQVDKSSATGSPQLDVSNSPDPLAGRYQAYSELGEGAIKGAKETARTVGGWLGEAFGSPNVKPEDQPLAPFKNQDLEAKTPTESMGKGMESVAEFVLGDEALKGLTLMERAKHLGDVAKVLDKS
jgi:hypothetical protein